MLGAMCSFLLGRDGALEALLCASPFLRLSSD